MSTVGTVGKPPEHPAKPEPGKPAQPEQPKQPEKTPKQEFQAIINDWAAMLPIAFINRLEDFASKHIK